MQNIQSLILIGLTAVNVFTFAFVGADKKKSVVSAERSPEVMFFLLAALFGSLGIFLGMFFFRHKTRKLYFVFGIALLLIQQIGLVYLLSLPTAGV